MVEDSWIWRPGPGATRAERQALGTAGGYAARGGAQPAWELEPAERPITPRSREYASTGRERASVRERRASSRGGYVSQRSEYSGYRHGSAAPASRGEMPARKVRQRRRARPKPAAALLILGALAWLIFGYASGVVKILQIRHEMTAVKQEMAAVQSRNRDLEQKVKEMQSPEYVEKIARTELGLIKPGEVKFVMSKSVDASNTEGRDIAKKPEKPNLIYH